MPEPLVQEIIANEEQLTQATRALDLDELDHLYADDMVMTSVLGETCRKAAVMDEARRGAAMRKQAADAGNAGHDDVRQGRLDGRSAGRRSR